MNVNIFYNFVISYFYLIANEYDVIINDHHSTLTLIIASQTPHRFTIEYIVMQSRECLLTL